MALQEGKIYPAHIESYASDGTGVARIDGMVVFVHGAVRGEEADVCIEHVGHNAAWAHIATLRTPSPARIEPDCPHYRQCGGCQFRHMTYEEELCAKRQRVEDALHRLGGLTLPVSAIHGAKDTQGYRNKVQFPVSGDGIGYYRSRTHQVIDIPHCSGGQPVPPGGGGLDEPVPHSSLPGKDGKGAGAPPVSAHQPGRGSAVLPDY